jgi:uncharacterized membrane protein YgcG
MNIIRGAARLFSPRLTKCILASGLSVGVLFASGLQDLGAQQGAPPPVQSQDQVQQDAPPPVQSQDQVQPDAQRPQPAPQTPDQLQRLVAPIALYPDSLVAQILAASTFPEQVVEADRWVQANPNLKGDALGQAVDQQPWDPSVKALTAFPSVLGNMDKNLSWTSSLGDAYYNQQQDVMDAVQVMRQRAQQAGNLKTTPQQTVSTDGSTVVIQPADPNVVYVPAYNPWMVYGAPIGPWPYWYPYPGIWYGGPYLSFGIGFGIGFYGGFGWGWNNWGFNWHNHYAIYNHNRYYSRSATFYNRNSYYRGGGGFHGGVYNRPGATTRPFNGDNRAARGYAQPHAQSGTRSGAFSGYDRGGQARSYSSRGSSSFGGSHGGGAPHGGGGRPR